jgi:hypothetical protein
MHGEESRKLSGAHQVVQENLCSRTRDHVVQNYTTVHHLPHLRFRPNKSWVPYNGKTRLEHTKFPLDILPSCLLTYGKPRLLLQSWSGNCLHKCRPRWIDTIGEVVPFGVGVVVDLEVNRRRMSLGQSYEHRRSLQYVDVIVGSRHPKEKMPSPQVVITNSSLSILNNRRITAEIPSLYLLHHTQISWSAAAWHRRPYGDSCLPTCQAASSAAAGFRAIARVA